MVAGAVVVVVPGPAMVVVEGCEKRLVDVDEGDFEAGAGEELSDEGTADVAGAELDELVRVDQRETSKTGAV